MMDFGEFQLPFSVFPEVRKIYGTPCGPVTTVSNGGDMSHCEETLSGMTCQVVCEPKFMPITEEIQCIDGRWTESECHERIFVTESNSFNDVWRLCGKK
eukprot:TRINITY_DN3893_c0_g1_i1.p3 TRINITY_DN3893_c0_g1~~TRINITY_DN3893_c0_g1_i1.p3  ORF type:complete len:107 (-),score=20.47 TRINITY_DN3893_c0_g1_i1:265-561(-)